MRRFILSSCISGPYTVLLILILFFALPYLGNSQDPLLEQRIDSIETILDAAEEDEERHRLISEIIELTKFKNSELSILYCQKLLSEGKDGPADKYILHAKLRLAKNYQLNGAVDSSFVLLYEVLQDARQLDLQNPLWRAYMHMGNGYDMQANGDSTFHYFKAGYDLKDITNDTLERNKIITTFGTNLGNFYLYKGEVEIALNYFTEASEACLKVGNLNSLGVIYNCLGNIYTEKNENVKAIEYYNKSIDLREELGNKVGILYVVPNLLTSYLEIEEYDLFFEKGYWAKAIADELEIPMFKLLVNSFVARGETQCDRPQKALELINEVAVVAEMEGLDVSILLQYYESCFSTYFALGQYRKAEKYLLLKSRIVKEKDWVMFEMGDYINKVMLYNALGVKDSVSVAMNQLSDATIKKMEAQVEDLGRIEASYTNLETQQKVELLEKEKIALSAISARNLIAAISALAIALLTLFFLYRNNRQKRTISRQNQELESLNSTKDQLFSIIGHDLKKPAIAFRGITEKLRFLIDSGDRLRLLKYGKSIENDAIELNNLTDNLLSWALLQKDLMAINEKEVSLATITEGVFSLFSNVAKEKKITLSSNVGNVVVHSDENALSIVLRNLVDNAIKYTSENGIIEITAVEEASKVELFVKDNGIGIEKDHLPNLFALTKEKSTDGTFGEKGTGLGLHLVKELVEKCKGTIAVESKIDRGTIFTLSFPY